jgi:hypothetical protein
LKARVECCSARFRDGGTEGWVFGVGEHQIVDRSCSSGFAEDGDFGRITAEGVDVALHPVESKALVEEAQVGFVDGELRGAREAVEVGAVIDGDDDDILVGSKGGAVVDIKSVGTEVEASL